MGLVFVVFSGIVGLFSWLGSIVCDQDLCPEMTERVYEGYVRRLLDVSAGGLSGDALYVRMAEFVGQGGVTMGEWTQITRRRGPPPGLRARLLKEDWDVGAHSRRGCRQGCSWRQN